MIESEVYPLSISESLPPEILARFQQTQDAIEMRSSLHWAEHCVECAVPQCYTSCDLYEPRFDGKCQRFVNGIESVSVKDGDPLLKIQFKQWAKLETQGSHKLYSIKDRNAKERGVRRLDGAINHLYPMSLRAKVVKKRYFNKKQSVLSAQSNGQHPDQFFLEVYNPEEQTAVVTLEIRSQDPKFSQMPFLFRCDIEPGYNSKEIPFDEIEKRLNLDVPYVISLIPENMSRDHALYFGVMDFVNVKAKVEVSGQKSSKKIKCAIWDLDNTIWEGVLIEDGLDKLVLKEGIEDVLKSIEERGIINSIASKNNFEPAMNALQHFGLDEYFVFPQISWGPKSMGIKKLAKSLNVNLNTFIFIDDNPFELDEVSASLPSVRVVDSINYNELLSRDDFDVPITKESGKRKQFYLNEQARKETEDSYDGDYFNFLKQCEITIEILSLDNAHFNRVYELAQRTNQMNFTGNRYSLEDIEAIHKDENLLAHVLKCDDKYGEYGIVGFAIVNLQENKLIDLMFSCRIQSKRVEHAYMHYLLSQRLKYGDFSVVYSPTEKNKFSAQVFIDMQFERKETNSSIIEMFFKHTGNVPDDGVIKVMQADATC